MKKWLDPITTAWTGVISHKLRSFLTILGIVIGVGAVIALMSVGRGAESEILSNIQSLGSNTMTVRPGGAMFFGANRGGGTVMRSFISNTQTLTEDDAAAIAELPDISAVSPTYSSSLQLNAGGETTNAQVTGVNQSYFEINNLTIGNGLMFTESEYQASAKVVVLGSNIAETLFPNSDPIGQQIRMGTIIVRVIGVMEEKGATFSSPDDGVYMPLTAMQQTVAQPRTAQGDRVVSSISLMVTDQEVTQTVIADIESLLRTRHHLAAMAENDFNIQSVQELAETISAAIGTFTILLGAIAAISLLVGGIGVMNIMLVSVLERTREIGIRKALGARQADIWGQFLIEAAFLSLAGGIVGIICGWGVSYIISRLGLMSTLVTPDIVILAVSVSVGIGLFFGFYPAWNASRLNPIDALRSE
jgi:putative ABC transport system permease protein